VADFDDLLAANKEYAADFEYGGFDGIAHAGVAIVTCMDSRIDPLRMLGLSAGDAKIIRNPGDRILVIPHTRCAMASSTEAELRERVGKSAGQDASWQSFHAIEDQQAALADDVARVRAHPLIPDSVHVGGFLYDVDTGLLEQQL
jgi:carbonic anhydrase